MLRHAIIFTCGLLAACTAPVTTPAPHVVTHDAGGMLVVREATIARFRAEGRPVEINGRCSSACTLFLGVDDVCIYPGSMMDFHGPSAFASVIIPGIPQRADWAEHNRRWMAEHYPSRIAEWFMAGPAYLHGLRFETLTAREVVEMSDGHVTWCVS